MHDAFIEAMEPAARIYCEKQRLDPDANVPVPHEQLQNVMVPTPMWRLVAEKMVDLTLMLQAMKEAQAQRAGTGSVVVGHG